jgi:hypothetical protein
MKTHPSRLSMTAVIAAVLLMVASGPAQAAQAKFASAQNYRVGDSPEAVVSADFNGDSKLDLAVANLFSNNVSVLLGNGDGTFGTTQNFAAGGGPGHLINADFNGDSKTDLAVANLFSDNVSVLLGNGDGTFAAAQNFAAGDFPLSVTSADYNGDSKLDLAVANRDSDNISVLLGRGDGTFAAAVNYATGDGPASVTGADFNGDSKLDLAAANGNRASVSVHLGNGDGTFAAAQQFGVGSGPWYITSADYNGDSKADLATAYNGSFHIFGGVSVLLGNGDGTFGAARNFSAGDTPVYLANADYDGDSKLDLAVANYFDDNVSVLSGNGDGTFGAAQNFGAGDGPASVTAADFNADTKADLAVANENTDNVSVLLNTTGQNEPPVANGDSYKVKEDRTLRVVPPGVLGNDTDLDGDALTANLVSGPSKGRLALNADGSITYRPKRNFHGTDSFTYKASDGQADSNSATVTIRVRSMPG